MADLPPQYTPYQIDDATKNNLLQQYTQQANQAVAPQIQSYQAQTPLIQKMYADAQANLQNQLHNTTQQFTTNGQQQIGQVGVNNAAKGIYNSSVMNNMTQNINDAVQNRINQATLAEQGQANNLANEQSQKEALITQAIAKLQGDAQNNAQQMLQNYITGRQQQAQAAYDDAWRRYSAQAAQENANAQRAQALQLAGISHGDAAQAHQDAINQQNMNNWIGAWQNVLQQAAGKDPATAQNDVYRFLNANQGAMKAQGVDPNALGFWNTWQQMKNGVPVAQASHNVGSGSLPGDFQNFANWTGGVDNAVGRYLTGNNNFNYGQFLQNLLKRK